MQRYYMYLIDLEDGGMGLVTAAEGEHDPVIDGQPPVATVVAESEEAAEAEIKRRFESMGFGTLNLEHIESH